ncbi:MAG: hypothetical protein LBD73_08110 [Deferribacteraceae bacterium]|jgi:hypothetical protein|nr:hypothetical protein [Deferribacteraceae bacterium]
MEIKVINPNEITISGNIKTVSDYLEIKGTISSLLKDGGKELAVSLPDSVSITSSVIGYFLKLVYQDGVKLRVLVGDQRLAKLLEDLRLAEAFCVGKV